MFYYKPSSYWGTPILGTPKSPLYFWPCEKTQTAGTGPDYGVLWHRRDHRDLRVTRKSIVALVKSFGTGK